MTPEEQRIIQALLGGAMPGDPLANAGMPGAQAQKPQAPPPSIMDPAGFQAYQEGSLGADRTFAPGPGTRVAQAGGFTPDGMTPQEWRETTWDESVADDYDKQAGDNAIEWAVEGKRDDVAKSLAQLREAQAKLESGADNLSGPFVGSWLGQQVAPMVNPESIVTREAIEEVVQRNLRLVLGAQFTEKEGERLISRAFNPKLQEPENAKRVGRLLRSIEDAAASREAATQYFMRNGTLVGWDGRIPSMSDIERSMDQDPAAQPDADGWTTINGVRVRVKQ